MIQHFKFQKPTPMKQRHQTHSLGALALLAFMLIAAIGSVFIPLNLPATPATAERSTQEQSGTVISVPLAASTTLYAGTLACVNTSGYAITAANTAGLIVAGVVDSTAVNSGSAGDASVRIKRGVFKFANSGTNAVDQDDVGRAVYVEDNQTVGDAGSGTVYAGICVKLDTDGVWVDVRETAAPAIGAPSVTVANAGTPNGNATVTIQAKDARGNNITGRCVVHVWFAATTYAAPADLGTLTASTGGILKEDTDDALATCQTDATGLLVLVLDTTADGNVHAHASVGGLSGTGSAAITGN
jgi:predicted RecA/RadA family phage recombinase